MGRKIPGKKHRSIKDPYLQRRQRFATIKDKVNNPPQKGKEDEQKMPKSVLRIMQLKEKAKKQSIEEKTKKKKKRSRHRYENIANGRFDVMASMGKERTLPGMKEPDRYMPDFTQRENEDLPKLAYRLQEAAKDMVKELKYEEKFNVAIKRDDNGQVLEVKQLKRQSNSKKPKLAEKRKAREVKKLAGREVEVDFEKMDKFEFGDIVHAPPENLTLPARKGKEVAGRKPGKTDLLLKRALTEKSDGVKTKPSELEKQRIEARRQAAVEAFRQLKKNRTGS